MRPVFPCLLAFLALLLLSAPPASFAQEASSDSTDLDIGGTFYPLDLWSSTYGFGIGGGVRLENALRPGTNMLATARISEHLGAYSLGLTTADLFESPRYALLRAYHETTGAKSFFGLGPASDPDNELLVEKELVAARLRYGQRLLENRLLIEPSVGLRYDLVKGFENENEGAFDHLDPVSQQNLQTALGQRPETSGEQVGLTYGLRLTYDTRGQRVQPRRGVYAELEGQWYESTGDLDLSFTNLRAGLYGFVPLPWNHTLALRAQTALTDQRGSILVPFYFLSPPSSRRITGFSRFRFYGNDLFQLALQYRFPFFVIAGLADVNAFVGASAGSVYDDLFDQFEPRLTFEKELSRDRERYPLRPAVSAGGSLVLLFFRDLRVRGALGYSAGGLNTASFSLIYDLNLRPDRF